MCIDNVYTYFNVINQIQCKNVSKRYNRLSHIIQTTGIATTAIPGHKCQDRQTTHAGRKSSCV